MHLVMVGSTTPSHVYPSLALIAELVARGHRVSYEIGDRLAAPGRADRRAGRSPTTTLLPDTDAAWPEDAGRGDAVFLDDQIAVLPALLGRSSGVDAVLYDIGGFAGRVAAHHWGVPAIQLSPTYVAWQGYEEDMAEFTDRAEGVRERQALLRDAARVAGRERHVDLRRRLPRAARGVRRADPARDPAQRGARRARSTCSPARASTPPAPTGWTPRAGTTAARSSTSRSARPTPTCRTSTRGSCASSARTTGSCSPPARSTRPSSPGVDAARVQPQLDVLAHADVFITHAGMGGTVESLWFGVPTVGVPQAVDQFTNAAQLEAIGAGVQLGERSFDEAVARGAGVRAAGARAARDGARARRHRQGRRRGRAISDLAPRAARR